MTIYVDIDSFMAGILIGFFIGALTWLFSEIF